MNKPYTIRELMTMEFEDPFYQTDEERKAEIDRINANYERANMIAKKGPKEIIIHISFEDEVKARNGLSRIVNSLESLELNESSSLIISMLAKGEEK